MYQVVAKPPNVVVFADFDTICEAANVSVSEKEVSSPLHLCLEHYYATYSYCRCVSHYVSVDCVVVKVNTMLVMTRGCL